MHVTSAAGVTCHRHGRERKVSKAFELAVSLSFRVLEGILMTGTVEMLMVKAKAWAWCRWDRRWDVGLSVSCG